MAEAQEQEQPKGGNKNVIIFAGVVVIAIAASVGGTLFFIGGSEPETPVAEDTAPATVTAIYHSLRPAFIVNYVTAGKSRYLQTELTVMARDPAVIDAVITHTPLVRSRILSFLTDQEYLELQSHEGKEGLRAGLKALVDSIIEQEAQVSGVETVLLTNFVMQ